MAENNNNTENFDTKSVDVEVVPAETAPVADDASATDASAVEDVKATKKESKTKETKSKSQPARPNFFVRVWKKLVKFLKDTKGELKKVVWTPKAEVIKSFKLVIATVVAVGLCIAVVDTVSSLIINSIAGLIG